MHKRFVVNIISRVLLFVCFIMLIPLGWAMSDDIHHPEVNAFILTIIIGTIISTVCLWNLRIKKGDYKKLNTKDGLAIVGISWIVLSLFGALPLYFSGVVNGYTDAFFEIASGFTTTGATIFEDIEALPHGILFWRSLTHWLGGMGIIVLYIALLPALGGNASQLYKAEVPGLSVERIEPRIKETAKHLWGIYFFLSLMETILLMAGGMPIFDALCHTFSTMATGGFSTKNASIGAYSPYIQWVITVFMFFAGMNFILHYQLSRGKLKAIIRNEEFKIYFFAAIIVSTLFGFLLSRLEMSESPFRDAFFQVISILTTTGFGTTDFEAWPYLLQFILVLMMFVGGCGGSTGGGMKIVRVYLSVKIGLSSIFQVLFPNAVIPIKFNKKPIPDKLVMTVMSYFVLYIHLFFVGTILFLILESCDIITALTASVSAISNIGPGLGQIGPTDNFAWVSAPGKWLLTFLMLAGRLEFYAIMMLFVPSAWRK